MSALFRILYAAHANGTHHKLALDALNAMGSSDAGAWQRVFLKHAAKYLEGSKAPDNTFKDFKNHVLHVSDSYWGGAPEKVEAWYATTVTAMRAGQWEDAAYAAGVLSHYYTDPVMPFHTGQTEAESNIHRAVEWSINRSYNSLRALGEDKFASLHVPVPGGEGWLKAMTLSAAEFSHRYYETLLAHYDITRGVAVPEEGLDATARTAVAELLIYAAQGFGRILDRAIAEAGVAAPEVTLTLETVIAALNVPQKWIEKRLTNAEDKKLVQAMYDELKTTGRVETHLPEDDRTVRDLHAAEVAAPKLEQRSTARAARLAVNQLPETRAEPNAPPETPIFEAKAIAPLAKGAVQKPTAPARPPSLPSERDEGGMRVYLHEGDALEAAPSIGPKMAERFAGLGILTVGDFLARPAKDMAEQLADNRLDQMTLEEWQAQARLVMTVPGLRGTGAQLLTGAGYFDFYMIAGADAVALSADILKFAASPEGKRILRDGNPPDIEKIRNWLDAAKLAKAA
jgi:predicted flap endonuclease-1-like 5' DNA nuclease